MFEAEAFAGTLAAAADRVRVVVPARTTIPILSFMRLTFVETGRLEMAATDLDQLMVVITESAGSGTVCVVAQDFALALSRLDKTKPVTLKTDEAFSRLIVTQGRARFALPILPSEDWPAMTPPSNPVSWRIPSAKLAEALASTIEAASTEETRYYLCGVFLDMAKRDHVALVATNGHWLARDIIDAPARPEDAASIIIPSLSVRAIINLAKLDEAILLEWDGGKIRATAGGVTFVSKLIDGTYPDYGRVIPKAEGELAFRIASTDLERMISRICVAPSTKSKHAGPSLSCRLTIREGELNMRARGEDTEAEDAAAVTIVRGEQMSVGVNIHYLTKALKSLGDAAEAEMDIRDAQSPILFRDPKAHDLSTRVVMPLRV